MEETTVSAKCKICAQRADGAQLSERPRAGSVAAHEAAPAGPPCLEWAQRSNGHLPSGPRPEWRVTDVSGAPSLSPTYGAAVRHGSPKSMNFIPWKKMLGGYQPSSGASAASCSVAK